MRRPLRPFRRAPGGPAAVRIRGAVVEAYDSGTGARRWTYGRRGSRPLALCRALGHTFALWADGLLTDTGPRRVRRHRAVPGLRGRLARQPERAAGVLLLAQPCREGDSWSQEPAAVDGLGKITPGRTPLGNELPGGRPTDRGGNRVARPS
ncbi:hypothetical protein ACFV98_07905 [Streptomyces violascens]|uniref:hypothetical protein n=1 Tax=Streptomyces violascens TaxID=67381 RepID=UPI0036697B32